MGSPAGDTGKLLAKVACVYHSGVECTPSFRKTFRWPSPRNTANTECSLTFWGQGDGNRLLRLTPQQMVSKEVHPKLWQPRQLTHVPLGQSPSTLGRGPQHLSPSFQSLRSVDPPLHHVSHPLRKQAVQQTLVSLLCLPQPLLPGSTLPPPHPSFAPQLQRPPFKLSLSS